MKQNIASLVAGTIFGIGLYISQMVNPSKVIGFLDLFGGKWDPSLGLVMVGAIGVFAITFRIITKSLKAPLWGPKFFLPTKTQVEPNIIIGPIIFGIGWGLAGICPGPAIANFTTWNSYFFIFMGAVVGGMIITKFVEKALAK